MIARKFDRRLTPATDRVAHISLQGVLDRPGYVDGTLMEVTAPLVDLRTAPDGVRDRQLVLGEAFCVLDEQEGMCFGFALKDGFCGWLARIQLAPATPKTHYVTSPGTHLYPGPKVQGPEIIPLYLGARLTALAVEGAWTKVVGGYVPRSHLREIGDFPADPVALAEAFIGTPYLWGGNSRAGLDCSGLVQLTFMACGIPCPADSDLQAKAGAEASGSTRRGDLIFWKGHVAMALDQRRLIHANGHHMAVAIEGICDANIRIAHDGGGPVIARRRLLP